MRVLMLSWEFPPKSVGGLAQHVYDLTSALAAIGGEVHVVTCGAPGIPSYEQINGVHVHRANPYNISAPDFVTWVVQLNLAMLEQAIPLLNQTENFHIMHAHDWLVAYAARVLKYAYHLPLVATIHATEYGRNCGLHNDLQRHISDIEWWLTYEAWQVICCSQYMKGEIQHVFQVPEDKINIIANGVNSSRFAVKKIPISRNYYAAPEEKIVFSVGRLVREKGIQVLLDAIPEVLIRCPNTKFVIAGKGPYEEVLRQQAARLGIAHRVYFTGYITDEVRNLLYHWADVAVFPSLYEPFGIVALESMAARTAVIVSDTGGLKEIVEHGVDGLKVYPGNPKSLADMVVLLLQDEQLRENLRYQAFRKVQRHFNWRQIALKTREVYWQIYKAACNTGWYECNEHKGRLLFNRVTRLLARA